MRMLTKALASAAPLLVIAGLVYAGLFVKPKAVGASLPPAIFERGDAFYGLTMPTASSVWIAGTDGKVIRSNDAGGTWAIQKTPTRNTIQDIAAWDTDHAVAVGNRGVVIYTSDGGKSWKEGKAPISQHANKLMRVRALPGGVAWAVGEFGALIKSDDFGATWSRAAEEEDAAWNDVIFIGEKGWLVGEFGRMKQTNDGGRSWRSVNSGVSSSLMAVHFRNASSAVAVGLTGVILVTEDGGANWRPASSPVREHLFDVVWSGSQWVAVGNKGLVLVADAPNEKWTASQISKADRSWHTRLAASGSALYVAGGSLVAAEAGNARSLVR